MNDRLAKIKTEILCRGIKSNDAAAGLFSVQNPGAVLKTGNNGIFIKLDGACRILANIIHKTNAESKYMIQKDGGGYFLEKDGVRECRVDAMATPDWMFDKTGGGRPAAEIFLHEGEFYLHNAYKGCDYAATCKACKFCGTGRRREMEPVPGELGEVADMALRSNPGYQICLGGGTYLPARKNVEYFSDAITSIRRHNKTVPIWVEMVPPSLPEIKELADAGATSFGFNIEVWDDGLRKEVCPGKSEVSKRHYIDALLYAKSLCGANKAGSCLIAGLESAESAKEGVDFLADNGIHPCVLPFRPYDNSAYEKRAPCDPALFWELTEHAARAMIRNNLTPSENEGCMRCDCCSPMAEVYEIQKGQR